MAGWHFLSIPKQRSEAIKKDFAASRRGWGSLRVKVVVGRTAWNTSIFPDARSGTYLLPLKAEVRKKEGIAAKDIVSFLLEILEESRT